MSQVIHWKLNTNGSAWLSKKPTGITELSRDITYVSICNDDNITELPPLPDHIKTLRIEHSEMLNLTGIPNNIETLYVDCPKITHLPKLPDSLQELRLENCFGLVSLEPFPVSLNTLVIDGYLPKVFIEQPINVQEVKVQYLQELPKFGDKVSTFKIYECCLQQSPSLPSTLNKLSIDSSTIKCPLSLPAYLLRFSVKYSSIAHPVTLPTEVEKFKIEHSSLSQLHVLSTRLDTLKICCNSSVPSLNISSSKIKNLHLSETDITCLPELPSTLEVLDCSKTDIQVLPKLPTTLKYLDCSETLVSMLPELPSSLEKLDCSMTRIIELPSLPEGLLALDCGASYLLNLPPLPSGLISLGIGGTRISRVPPLPQTLRQFYFQESRVAYLSSRIPTECRIEKYSTRVQWCFEADFERLGGANMICRRDYAACLRVASKVIAKQTAARLIQRNLRNWFDKPVCADGKLGIVPRLEMAKCLALSKVPMTMEDVKNMD